MFGVFHLLWVVARQTLKFLLSPDTWYQGWLVLCIWLMLWMILAALIVDTIALILIGLYLAGQWLLSKTGN